MTCKGRKDCKFKPNIELWAVNGSRKVCFNCWVLAFEPYRDQIKQFTQLEIEWFEKCSTVG